MKIGNLAGRPTPAGVVSRSPAANGTAAASSASAIAAHADASARIEVSDAASPQLSGAGTARFDADKVACISKAIDISAFKINPEAIADKLIANAQELLGQVRR